MKSVKKMGSTAIKQEAKGLQALAEKLDHNFDSAVEILKNRRLVIFTGIGKSGYVAQKLAATFTSMGTPAIFLHPVEAAHGDLGIITPEDALIALSRSGKASELYPVVNFAWNNKVPAIFMTENNKTSLADLFDYCLVLPKVAEAWGHAPTTSTVMQMAYGDALAVVLANLKGYKWEDFQKVHPGGVLNKQ